MYFTDHGELRSFPTRRSSDLGDELLVARILTEFGQRWRPIDELARIAFLNRLLQPAEGGRTIADLLVSTGDDRSEEHTSELQSQSNLVCRLLLEKKKQTTLLR